MIKNKLKRAMNRSENAYMLYIHEKKYFQALRIYQANKIVYELLNEYIFECNEIHLKLVYEYLYHLEDWFAQFENEKLSVEDLNQSFAFQSLEGSIRFPKDFKSTII